MTIMEMLGQSGVLAVLGMSMVFGFLIIMIISITVVGKIMQASGAGNEVPAPVQVAAASTALDNNASVTAVISAAVMTYRKSNQQ